MATQSPPGRQFLGASRDSNTPAPAGLLGDIRSAARFHGLKRIAGFVVGAGVFMSLEPAPIVGGPQLVFGIYKPPRPLKKPSKAAAADLPKAVSAGGSGKAPAAGVTKAAAAASNKAAPNVSTKAVPGGSPSQSAALLDNYPTLHKQLREVTSQAFSVAQSDCVLKLVSDRALRRGVGSKLHGGFLTTSLMSLQPQRILTTDKRGCSFPCAFDIGMPTEDLHAGFAAGAMLLTQTNEELFSIMAFDIAYIYAYHEAERKSWRLLLNTVIIGSLAASSSMGLLPLAAAAIGIDAVVNKVIVGIWLHRRQ